MQSGMHTARTEEDYCLLFLECASALVGVAVVKVIVGMSPREVWRLKVY